MSELEIPESWAKGSLDNIAKRVGGGTPSRANMEFYGGDIPWITVADLPKAQKKIFTIAGARECITEMAVSACATHKIPLGSVVLATRVSVGKVGIAGVELCTNQDFSSFIEIMIDNCFLANFLFSIQPFIVSQAKGTTIKGINLLTLNTINIPIPPVAEQRRIVAKIESTFKRIEAIEKAVETAESLLTKYRESLLNKAFLGELVPQDPNDEPASKLLERIRAERTKQQDGKKKQKDELPPITEDEIPFEIPKSWEWVRLGDICSKIGSGQTPHGGNSVYQSNGIPLIRSQNVLNGELNLSDVAFINQTIDENMKGSRVYGGDVLYNITGGSIGRSCVVPEYFTQGNVNQHVLSIRPFFRNIRLSQLISLFLLSPFGKDFIFKNKKGAAREAITKSQIENLIFPLPPEFEIERIILKIQSSIQNLASVSMILKHVNSSASVSKISILSSAFSGRLVPQDPAEGTGHELLEQILASKSKADAAQSTKSPTKKRKISK